MVELEAGLKHTILPSELCKETEFNEVLIKASERHFIAYYEVYTIKFLKLRLGDQSSGCNPGQKDCKCHETMEFAIRLCLLVMSELIPMKPQ